MRQCSPIKLLKKKRDAEDEWVKRQADYVRYLWESYQTGHFKVSDAQNVWQHAYKTLKQEFKDFKDMHADAEKKLEADNKKNKAELVKELLNRVASEEQSLNNETTADLLKKLQSQVIKQRRLNLIKQINSDVELIPPSRISKGCRKALKPSNAEQAKK